MWHEARKQEKFIRGLIVDYRRRAERRKTFYEQIKSDPTQFLQIHGRKCKIHFEVQNAATNDGPAIMMPWQGDTDNMIDRFDGRAYLDYLPEYKSPNIPIEELSQEERQCNYERYRVLAQNAFLGISEEKFLKQLSLEEQFGIVDEKDYPKEKSEKTGAAIGYNYDQPNTTASCSNAVPIPPPLPPSKPQELDDSDDSDLDSMDVDLSIDVNKMLPAQAHELNAVGPNYGMSGCDLFSFLTGDADDVETQKQILREEREKAMYSGRKSRRERRAHRDKRLADRALSPPSYAAQPAEVSKRPIEAESRSPSPDQNDKIQFITSFGGDDDEPSNTSKQSYADKLKANLKKELSYSEVLRKARPNARSRSSSREIVSNSKRLKTGSYRRRSSRSRSNSSRSRSRNRKSRSRSRKSRSRSRKSRSCSKKSRSRSLRSRSRSRKSRSRSRLRRSISRSKRSISRSRRSMSRSRRSRSRSRKSRSRSWRTRSRSGSRTRRFSRRSASRCRKRSRSRSSSNYGGERSRSRSVSSIRRTSYRRNSRSYSPQVSRGYSRNESSNMDNEKYATQVKAPIPRYYGRRREDNESSSELSIDSDASDHSNAQDKPAVGVKTSENQKQLAGPVTKVSTIERDIVTQGEVKKENASPIIEATAG